MNYFPVFFDLSGQKVLVVGGGEVALRKISLLERTHALITLVAPEIAPELLARAAAGTLKLAVREFEPADLDGVRLVIVATSRRAVNRWIANLSESRNIPVNVVDDREASRFIVPAIIDRDPVLVAVSTGGTSPVLARRLRERLEALIPGKIGELALWLKALRRVARRQLRGTEERRRFFEAIVDGPAAQRFVEGDSQGAQRIAQQLLATTSTAPRAAGDVTLVGAGPGDPELLTLKALRALQDADVILHDRLVAPEVLDLARRDAARICVGKAAGAIGSTQEEINALLIELANQGKRVVRLKGGDPFVFGRGGEELQALAKARINFSGGARYHRGHRVRRVCGHSADASRLRAQRELRDRSCRGSGSRARLARTGDAGRDGGVLHGPGAPGSHRGKTLEHGAPATRPAGIIAQGTTANQRVISATLATIRGVSSDARSGIAGSARGGRRRGAALDAGVVQHRLHRR